ncbi:YgaP family membrane protein [Bradyrhizobium japonicum]|uniref:YgaP family membrane protein n=1 Tax=Bradyrhizobium japonicum TaxID=375 RepID=UPI0035E1D0D6
MTRTRCDISCPDRIITAGSCCESQSPREAFMLNVGVRDAVLRYSIGIILLATLFHPDVAWRFESWGSWKHALAVVALVLVATAISHVCPSYWILGINTCDREPVEMSRDDRPQGAVDSRGNLRGKKRTGDTCA